jgi:hypothetical protein
MTLALRSPEIINDIVSVDNAPLDAALLSNFGKYIQGMKKIEEAGVTRQAEADKILVDYEEVSNSCQPETGSVILLTNTTVSPYPTILAWQFIPTCG